MKLYHVLLDCRRERKRFSTKMLDIFKLLVFNLHLPFNISLKFVNIFDYFENIQFVNQNFGVLVTSECAHHGTMIQRRICKSKFDMFLVFWTTNDDDDNANHGFVSLFSCMVDLIEYETTTNFRLFLCHIASLEPWFGLRAFIQNL